jgi:spore coat protein JB
MEEEGETTPMSRDELLAQLSAADFYLIELNLYLNTHPTDAEAISLRNTMVKKAKELREEYERSYGMLLANMSASKVPWQWIENPWPWQTKFNFALTGENQ